MLIRLIPIGDIPQSILELVKQELEGIFRSKCRILTKLEVPKDSFNHWRKQYNAEIILNTLENISEVKFIDKSIPTLLITDIDLYYGGLNFIFGLEDPQRSCAIVSMARLKPEFYDQKRNPRILSERLVKEAVHGMGHHLGLEHCSHPFCVMCFSPSVQDVDKKQKYFCDTCKVKAVARGINIE